MDYLRVYESGNGGVVNVHPMHGIDELRENLLAACIIARHGHLVELLPVLSPFELGARKKLLPDAFGNRNPDVRIDARVIGDIKTPDLYIPIKQSTISRSIYACARQKAPIAIINLLKRDYTVQDIRKGIIGALQPERNKAIEEVWVITTKGNLFKVKRTMVFNESTYDTLGMP